MYSGNLAPASIKIFANNPKSKFICNVGCCYHHITEEFYVNPNPEKSDSETTAMFPMSEKLRSRKYWLGRNARNLAAQPLERLAAGAGLPSKSMKK